MTTFSSDKTIDPVDSLNKAATLIGMSLVYTTSPPGHDYWREVVTNLRLLAMDAEKAGFPTQAQIEYTVTRMKTTAPAETKPLNLIHILYKGQAGCTEVKDTPRTWPVGHEWVYINDAEKATCNACKVALKKMGVI